MISSSNRQNIQPLSYKDSPAVPLYMARRSIVGPSGESILRGDAIPRSWPDDLIDVLVKDEVIGFIPEVSAEIVSEGA